LASSGAIFSGGAEQRAENIYGLEQDGDNLFRGGYLYGAETVQQVFEGVGETDQNGEAERAGPAFDRVGRTEDGVENFGVGGRGPGSNRAASIEATCSALSCRKVSRN